MQRDYNKKVFIVFCTLLISCVILNLSCFAAGSDLLTGMISETYGDDFNNYSDGANPGVDGMNFRVSNTSICGFSYVENNGRKMLKVTAKENQTGNIYMNNQLYPHTFQNSSSNDAGICYNKLNGTADGVEPVSDNISKMVYSFEIANLSDAGIGVVPMYYDYTGGSGTDLQPPRYSAYSPQILELSSDGTVKAFSQSSGYTYNRGEVYRIDYAVDFATGAEKLFMNGAEIGYHDTNSEISNRAGLKIMRYWITLPGGKVSDGTESFCIDNVKVDLYKKAAAFADIAESLNTAVQIKEKSATLSADGNSVTVTSKVAGSISESANVLTAVYCNKRLVDVDMQEFVNGKINYEASLDISRYDEGTFIGKTFVLNTDLTPLCPAEEWTIPVTAFDIDVNFYPGWVRKAVTTSWDDLSFDADMAMIKRFEEGAPSGTKGLAASFNFVGQNIADYLKWHTESLSDAYAGYEIANHTYSHNNLKSEELSVVQEEVLNGYNAIKAEFPDNEIRGFVWPENALSDKDEVWDWLRSDESHIKYARCAGTTGDFDLPEDWYNWKPTCTTTSSFAAEGGSDQDIVDKFIALEDDGEMKLFFIWGHAVHYGHDSYPTIKPNVDKVIQMYADHKDTMWTATQGEIYDYVNAVRNLKISRKGIISNNSNVKVYIKVNGEQVTIEAGERYTPGI